VHDTDVIVSTGSRTAGLISHTSAASFAPFPSPSKGLPCNYQEQARPVIWAQCATGMMSSVWRSANGGQSFGPAAGSARPGSRIELPNSAAFGAASSDVAVVGYNQLYRTADAGVTWAPVGPAGYDWLYLGFTDSTHGVALGTPQNGGNEQLWYTTDAGETYHLVNVG
jgi:photosystem II stability/assembly factor-like uncharacterized protein